eukprot:4857-Prymnesium_polylepis.1
MPTRGLSCPNTPTRSHRCSPRPKARLCAICGGRTTSRGSRSCAAASPRSTRPPPCAPLPSLPARTH